MNNQSKRLKNALEQFVPAQTVSEMTKQFEQIAQIVFNGRFVVNNEYEIYPIEIEFYFNDEEHSSIIDPQMYHVGNKVPYFPIGSVCPNRSGVDVTFEREGKYRASFLIRGYMYKSIIEGEEETFVNRDDKDPMPFKPQYLWDDLFGNASVLDKGLSVCWVDNEDYKEVRMKSAPRIRVDIVKGETEDRLWRFTNLDMAEV